MEFTCCKGLTSVGVDRSVWETIRDMKPDENYVHTIKKASYIEVNKQPTMLPSPAVTVWKIINVLGSILKNDLKAK